MLIGKTAQVAKFIHGTIQDIVVPILHRQLGLLSRVHPLPQELPSLPRDRDAGQSLVKFAEKLLRNDNWWKTAPEHYPLFEEEVESLLEVGDDPKFADVSQERKERLKETLITQGLSKAQVGERLRIIIQIYKTGAIPKS